MLIPTKPAPNFKGKAVINGTFKQISLQDYLGKYVVLFFYPADFTFVCPTEIIAYSERVEDILKKEIVKLLPVQQILNIVLGMDKYGP
ncbi:uncharacterized protein DC041_0011694 [Schistosoma bovis]|uniref:thioredoxin-dependent peroxiredoxin n=1 Tax=Schistosoma bovis TaxID=6184 RepID=A0A430QIK2_SCHBO|nr:uncharacterized protein DC041_0011694 [Schistosoma bovis]